LAIFLNFSYVCPEPVLVKRSLLYLNGAKKGVFLGRNLSLQISGHYSLEQARQFECGVVCLPDGIALFASVCGGSYPELTGVGWYRGDALRETPLFFEFSVCPEPVLVK
jgi:hypothetical protein